MRIEFSRATRVAALKRCTDEQGVPRCETCHLALKANGYAFDHVIPDQLGGQATFRNCAVLCTACHTAKTGTVDVPAIAKAKRREARHLGVATPPRSKIQGPGFVKAEPQHRASRPLNKWYGVRK
jgi:hypothetical protein